MGSDAVIFTFSMSGIQYVTMIFSFMFKIFMFKKLCSKIKNFKDCMMMRICCVSLSHLLSIVLYIGKSEVAV